MIARGCVSGAPARRCAAKRAVGGGGGGVALIGGAPAWSGAARMTGANPQPTPSARASHIIHQSTRFRPRRCLLGVPSIRLISWGSYPQNPSFLGTSMGIPSLNIYGRISAQEKHITTLDSSKCASRQHTQCEIMKTKRWGYCRGQTFKSLFQR
jgi:hypothetical protein